MTLNKPLKRPLAAQSADDASPAADDLGMMTPTELAAHGRRGLAKLKVQISAPRDLDPHEHEQEGDPKR